MNAQQPSFAAMLLSALCCMVSGCGGGTSEQGMPPSMPDVMCVELGSPAKLTRDCCSQGNLSLALDDLSRCCAGKACCASKNHSHHISDTECNCETGFEWVAPEDKTNLICKRKTAPPPSADLIVTEAVFNFYSVKSMFITAWTLNICLNKDPKIGPVSANNHVKVENRGNKDASSGYEVEFGIIDQDASIQTCIGTLRNNNGGTVAGSSSTWTGPLCCELKYLVSQGRYRTYVKVDVNNSIPETDKSNNIFISSKTDLVLN